MLTLPPPHRLIQTQLVLHRLKMAMAPLPHRLRKGAITRLRLHKPWPTPQLTVSPPLRPHQRPHPHPPRIPVKNGLIMTILGLPTLAVVAITMDYHLDSTTMTLKFVPNRTIHLPT